MDWLLDPDTWASLVTLSTLEVVLGVDNLLFVALLAGRLPPKQQSKARKLGLCLALAARLALLGSIAWIAHLTAPVVSVAGWTFSWRDLVLLGGGGFLLFKATQEIHRRVDDDGLHERNDGRGVGLIATIAQIVIFDVVFSLDSVITAVGMVDDIRIMVAAIVIAMILMLVAMNSVAAFIDRHESVRILALSFLLLIGMLLVADSFGFHVPRGYVYTAMGFSVFVEGLNLLAAQRRRAKNDLKQHTSRGGLLPPGKAR